MLKISPFALPEKETVNLFISSLLTLQGLTISGSSARLLPALCGTFEGWLLLAELA